MLAVCSETSERGAGCRAAERLGKDRSWVTNQPALLSLPDEIQLMPSSGEVSERDGRLLARRHKENPQPDTAALIVHLKQVRADEVRERAEERSLLRTVKQRKTIRLVVRGQQTTPTPERPGTEWVRDYGDVVRGDSCGAGGSRGPRLSALRSGAW